MNSIYKKQVPKSPSGLNERWPEQLRGPRPINLHQQKCSGCYKITQACKPRTQSFLIFCLLFNQVKSKIKIINILIINFIKI